MKQLGRTLVAASVVAVAIPAWAIGNFSAPIVCSGETDALLEVKTEPTIAITSVGTTLVAWQDMRDGVGGDIYLARSSGPGFGFEPPIKVNDDVRSPTPDWSWQHGAPALGMAPDGTAYVVWNDRRRAGGLICPGGGACDHDIYLSRSLDDGLTWQSNVLVNDTVDGSQSAPDIAVDGSGRVHVVWRDGRDSLANSDIYHAFSDDRGQTWSVNRSLSTDVTTMQVDPAIAASGDTVYVVWTDKRNGQLDVYGVQSFDRGATWSTPRRVHADPLGVEQSHPDVAVGADGSALVVWQDFRAATDDPDIYFNSNETGVFGVSLRVDDSQPGVVQTSPAVSVDSLGRPVIVWRDYRNGAGDIYFTRTVSGTPPFAFESSVQVNPGETLGSHADPSLGVNPVTGLVMVVWEDAAKEYGGVDISMASSLE